ncbi:Hypothetical predicted protein [Pelobates cultripes]|uniref:Uncharacterized protein n=1 Tax=Pelobates cultripes TaxID=61616 RepID=A0AAD1W611_PELCU|nr:Hypothetical predicted protein [Pelobates cultripes]
MTPVFSQGPAQVGLTTPGEWDCQLMYTLVVWQGVPSTLIPVPVSAQIMEDTQNLIDLQTMINAVAASWRRQWRRCYQRPLNLSSRLAIIPTPGRTQMSQMIPRRDNAQGNATKRARSPKCR